MVWDLGSSFTVSCHDALRTRNEWARFKPYDWRFGQKPHFDTSGMLPLPLKDVKCHEVALRPTSPIEHSEDHLGLGNPFSQ